MRKGAEAPYSVKDRLLFHGHFFRHGHWSLTVRVGNRSRHMVLTADKQ